MRSAISPNRSSARKLRRAAVALIGVGALSVSAAACTAGNAGGGSGGTSGGNGGSGATTSTKYLNYSPCCSWNATWSYNPYNVNGLGIANDFIVQRLAVQKYPSLTDYEPQLADKWSVNGSTMSVHIREGVKWQDNTPVTSKDLYDTVLLDGLRGDGLWSDITGLKIVDDQTVDFTLREGQPAALAYNDILGNVFVYPSSVYGKFVTKQVEEDVPAYFTENQKDPTKAGKMDAFKRISTAFQKLASYKVDTLIGNGPFKLDNITTSQAKLSKWDGFYAADKIKMGGINFGNGSNQTIYPQLFSQQADFSNVYLPPPILQRWDKTPNAKLALPSAFGFVLQFNNAKAPLNDVRVRQALAYVIPRQTMSEAAYGTAQGAGGTWKEVNTGISPTLEGLYLTQDQINSLNKYPVDADKATQLLQQAGLKKSGGQWLLPNGKPFTLTFTANSDTSDIVTSFTSAAKALTNFGIKSDVNATTGAQQDADQHNGDFEIGMNFVGGNNPLGMYQSMMGSQNNYQTLGNYAGKRGIGVGPTANVPGLGNVNVSSTLDAQARNVAPDQKMKDLTWDWAQFVNQQVPYIWYATKIYQFSYSEKSFTNWPPTTNNGSSPLWDIVGANTSAGVVLAMEQGYIVPKS
ncbi:peptide/nickel transport system substrate-binding protein [Friedmanniella endophytica]|uniref:Peptide/nickel transport system substrate-binding protein n=1 Tax=Microlunatus kandeliicorticis TaxID=1759536 RepID=A0A7W3IQ46_9ACTN|nr:ABC transporter substrate-binding protein [Microlunatus kandeliicorticis]MBA8793189.1 peptide/nickel transport system substrate-binding protein [Microlunatus kandeliicorticis]